MNIKNILTLRYDPESKPAIPPRSIEQFNGIYDDYDGLWTEKLLKIVLYEKLHDKNKIAISHSAGVDSNVVLSLTREMFPDKEIICICMGESERKESYKLSVDLQTDHVYIDPPDVVEEIPFYVKLTNEPRWNVYHHGVAKEAKKQGCDILLTGDGGDEVFAGYTFRYEQFLKKYDYIGCHRNDWVEDQEDLIEGFDWAPYNNEYRTTSLEHPALQTVFMLDFNGKLLYDFIPTGNKISKYYNIPIWSPFLDSGVIDYGCHIRTRDKFDGVIGKIPLRKILERRNIIISDKKMGFTYDTITNWKYHKTDSKFDGLWDKLWNVYNHGISYDWVWKHRHNYEYRYVNKMLQLYAYEEWLKL